MRQPRSPKHPVDRDPPSIERSIEMIGRFEFIRRMKDHPYVLWATHRGDAPTQDLVEGLRDRWRAGRDAVEIRVRCVDGFVYTLASVDHLRHVLDAITAIKRDPSPPRNPSPVADWAAWLTRSLDEGRAFHGRVQLFGPKDPNSWHFKPVKRQPGDKLH